jgi:PIN domain nuclease of toxin-antitoxin system
MKLLLDTHLLLWAAIQPQKLSAKARRLINDPENELLFSSASIWEIAIKQDMNRQDFNADARILRRALLDNGYSELSITGEHSLALRSLPPIHKDPFDRILLAQATTEGILLLTSDRAVAQYPAPVRAV